MPSGVVGHLMKARAREGLRAVYDVAPGGADAVQQDHRRALPHGLPGQGPGGALHRELHRLDRGHTDQAAACERRPIQCVAERVHVAVMEAEQGDVAIADDALGIDDEDRPAHEPARPQHPVGADRRSRSGSASSGTVSPYLARNRSWESSDCGEIPSTVGVELVESVGGVAVGAELAGADRREVARIEGEHEPLPAKCSESR